VLAALVGALERLTAQRKDTSRDTRMALIGRIREQGSAEQAPLFERLLRDFDPKIAEAAAGVLQALTGRSHRAEPRPRPRPAAPGPSELNERLVARVDLDTGRFFQVAFDRDAAPLAYARFARLIRARYYDGLTFHRVVPNFVIQGGSPGANEYEGDGPFMRDELSFRPHLRGTVGISTRGRHTGDAQIFVNLVDNARLDFDYTVAGEVIGDGMAVVDAIQEGTVIRRIRLLPPAR
jgi:cyclophilin family peptidyl-prolyl cis-trans isomerase